MGFAQRIDNSLHGTRGAKFVFLRQKGRPPRGWPKSYENQIVRAPYFRSPCHSSNGRDGSRLEPAQAKRTSSSAGRTADSAAHSRKYEGQDRGAVLQKD